MDAVEELCRYVAETTLAEVPAPARLATKTFLLDSLGVAAVGSSAPFVAELVRTQAAWGSGDDARLWVHGDRVPAPTAALINAYQVHNSEYDCVHEGAVVHPLAVLLSATLAVAERQGGVSGADLMLALAVGVDVAAGIGVAAKSPLRFFRPATAGAFGACAAIGKLRGFDATTVRQAMSAVYGQLSGTMQAHTEGSLMLALQVAFNARNAVVATDLAAAGLDGPRNLLEGPFGYFKLIETDYDWAPVAAALRDTWRITEVAHKPFPSGRATHGILEILLRMREQHDLAAADVASVRALVPPLVQHLIGRPAQPNMTANYARLSGSYVGARALLNGTVDVPDFRAEAMADAGSLDLAGRIEVIAVDNPDPNALVPITVELKTRDGRTLSETVDVIYGNPAKPMSREAHLAKFRRNLANAARPVPPENGERLIELVDDLESIEDATVLVELLQA
ncbi:MAG: MmgE/PrpD family protein [Alphaproteobacteria bacterium]